MSKELVVLAYSGGLDTSCILKWLLDEGYSVAAYVADVGQDEDFEEVRAKALAIGADRVMVEDLKEEFVTDFIFPAVKANAVYEGRYLLGTALARPLIARRQIEIAHALGARFVSHGSTGKGNDQVRFELGYHALDPNIGVIAPWKIKAFLDRFSGRVDLLQYAENNNIPVPVSKEKPFSCDENLMHISYESGMLEDPAVSPRADMFRMTCSPQAAPDRSTRISISFKDGVPVKVENRDDGTVEQKPLDLFLYLNRLGRENGVGRIDIVENRFVGIKSRGVYESPGVTILREAHMDIEGIAMDREVMRLRDMLSPKFAELVYNGFWFSPEMDFLMAAIDKSQEVIDGKVDLDIYKGNVTVTGRTSPSSLYDRELSSMDLEGGFDQRDSRGFININAVRLKAHFAILQHRGGKSR